VDVSLASADREEQLRAGEIVLDRAAYLVTVDGRAVSLAMLEFRLLELLMANADHALPTAAILERLWGPEFHGDPSTVAVHVLRLRRKLRTAAQHLRTVRGIGYVFDSVPH
jgi:DNA-binding response OmpR family regulator